MLCTMNKCGIGYEFHRAAYAGASDCLGDALAASLQPPSFVVVAAIVSGSENTIPFYHHFVADRGQREKTHAHIGHASR